MTREDRDFERTLYHLDQLIKRKENDAENLIDLHTHSCFSDGDLSPDKILLKAYQKGIRTLAITDHDSILGNQKIKLYQANYPDMTIIPGIELSAKTNRGRFHILGYGMDLQSQYLNSKMSELKDNSINVVLSLLEHIKKEYGILFTYSELRGLINSNHNLGRPDIAKMCVNKGYASNVQEAFDRYLLMGYSKIRSENKGLTDEECIEIIIKSGGIPVLAHPNTLKKNEIELRDFVKHMMGLGLMGIEVYHSNHSLEETNQYFNLANEYGLLMSGGTDFHGKTVKPDIELGTGRNHNVKLKQLSLVDYWNNQKNNKIV